MISVTTCNLKYFSGLISALLFSFTLSSCGDDDDAAVGTGNQFTFASSQFATVESGDLDTSSASEVKGSGSFVANTPLSAVDSGSHFYFASTLAPSSSLTLVGNGDKSNVNGVEMKFSNSDGSLKVTIAAGGKTQDISSYFSAQSATDVSYHIDLHNDETPSHVLIWAGNESGFSEEAALYNSEENEAVPGNGTGSYWGMTMTAATITAVAREEPKFEED